MSLRRSSEIREQWLSFAVRTTHCSLSVTKLSYRRAISEIEGIRMSQVRDPSTPSSVGMTNGKTDENIVHPPKKPLLIQKGLLNLF